MDQPARQDIAVELQVTADAPERRREPVACGVPWPRGVLHDLESLHLSDEQGRRLPLQARALDRWPDGSVRWSLLDWQADVRGAAAYRLTVAPEASRGRQPPEAHPRLRTETPPGEILIDTGAARFHLRAAGRFPLDSVLAGGAEAVDAARTRFAIEDKSGLVYEPLVHRLEVEETGTLRAAVVVEGDLARSGGEPLLQFIARLHFFAGSAAVRFMLTLRNPRKAEHPGGLWDLGNGGSVYLRDAALTLALPSGEGSSSIRCSPEVGAAPGPVGSPLELYQDSSGGDKWQIHNHFNRSHVVPHTFRGYRLRQGGAEQSGSARPRPWR